MFFIILLIFISEYFSSNSLKCMTSTDGNTLLFPCKVELTINESIPDDAKLTEGVSKCALEDADSKVVGIKVKGSCFADITIDYNTGKMTVSVTSVEIYKSMISPYDDMFGFANGITSVIQYKIYANLENKKLVMTTRIQCDTYDNCALDKLRKLLPNLQITKERFLMLKEVDKLVNAESSVDSTPSSCVIIDNGDQDTEECKNDQNRCIYNRSKNDVVNQGCTVNDGPQYDIEYRFNVIEEMETPDFDNSAHALKVFFMCRVTDCNNDGNLQSIANVLSSLAIDATLPGSNPDKGASTGAKYNAQKKPVKSKSSGILYTISIFHQSIMILFIIFRQLLN